MLTSGRRQWTIPGVAEPDPLEMLDPDPQHWCKARMSTNLWRETVDDPRGRGVGQVGADQQLQQLSQRLQPYGR